MWLRRCPFLWSNPQLQFNNILLHQTCSFSQLLPSTRVKKLLSRMLSALKFDHFFSCSVIGVALSFCPILWDMSTKCQGMRILFLIDHVSGPMSLGVTEGYPLDKNTHWTRLVEHLDNRKV
jgi:hypothetical protein